MKLVTEFIVEPSVVNVVEPTNRILVIDCSRSMSSDLPKLRTQLKNKLPTMIQPQDTLTIVWFSGKGQYGILFEGVKLDNLQDIAKINAAIDRFLTPIGMTAFVQPLQEVKDIASRLVGPCTLSFLSDGSDNAYSNKEIIHACKVLDDSIACATFVEYGYYANHTLLMEMSEAMSGNVILAEDFNSYTENLAASFKKSTSNKKIKVKKVTSDFVVGTQPDGFVVAVPDAVGTVTLPAGCTAFSYFEGAGDLTHVELFGHGALMVGALLQRGNADLALQVAALIGDEVLYNQVQNSFSKQDYMMSVKLATDFGTGKQHMFSKPRNTSLKQDPYAYNVLTMLMDLAEQEGNYLDITHPEFKYSAIGDHRATVETEGYVPVFADKSTTIKAEIKSLKFNEDRPNISILVKRFGSVNLPTNDLGFKDSFDTFIWRNYTIVKDGIVNVRKLPVVLCKATYDLFTQLGVITEEFKVGKTYVIDTSKYPIINRSMVEKQSATSMFTDCYNLYVLRTHQKYLNAKDDKPEVSEKFSALYGEDGAKFLKECGITEGGFSPKTVKGESVDPYMSKVLEIKLAGLSAIPKVEDVEKAIAAGKNLTVSQQVMKYVIDYHTQNPDEFTIKEVKKEINTLLNKIVMKKFGIIIGKTWFSEFTSYDDNMLDIEFGLSKTIACTAVLSDKEV